MSSINYGKTAFLKECRGKHMKACMIVNSTPAYGWRTITKANSKELVFDGHSKLDLSNKILEFVGYPESSGLHLRIFEKKENGEKGELKMLYALRRC